jgi:hypothetical protein
MLHFPERILKPFDAIMGKRAIPISRRLDHYPKLFNVHHL